MCVAYEYTCRYDESGDDVDTPVAAPTRTSLPSMSRTDRQSYGGSGNSGRKRFTYAGSSAAMAFPYVLSRDICSSPNTEDTSGTQSVGYNFGIRAEEASNVHVWLGDLISEDDLERYSGMFFLAMGSVGDMIDKEIYARGCKDYYDQHGSMPSNAFAAIAAGIAALGSFLSAQKYARESDLVQYAKAILDDPYSTRFLEVDHIVAWGMRVFYLRATTRPTNAWIASCTSMHLSEAIGLHDEEGISKLADAPGAESRGHDADRLRRIFWIAWAGHTILSYEYDRSSVTFRSVTTKTVVAKQGSIADQFIHIAQFIPSPNSPFRLRDEPSTQMEELNGRLDALHAYKCTDPFLIVTIADVAFCFFRRAYQLKHGIPDAFKQLVMECGDAAVKSANRLALLGRFFWNVIGSVFQYTCILLAIDNQAATQRMSSTFKCLKDLVVAANTTHTREALATARNLLSLHLDRKRREVAQAELIQGDSELTEAPQDEGAISGPSASAFEVDWDQFFFEPYISLFSDINQPVE